MGLVIAVDLSQLRQDLQLTLDLSPDAECSAVLPTRVTDFSHNRPEDGVGETLAVPNECAGSRRNVFRVHQDRDDPIHHGIL
jgi:hypothetical protein